MNAIILTKKTILTTTTRITITISPPAITPAIQATQNEPTMVLYGKHN